MDLQTAAKRYEENRRFWARELAGLLTRRYFNSRRILLRKLLVSTHPMLAATLNACLPPGRGTALSQETHTVNMLRELVRGGMVKRTGNRRTYWYTITELGELVCMYLPMEQDGEEKDNPPLNEELGEKDNPPLNEELGEKKRRGRPRKTLVAASGV